MKSAKIASISIDENDSVLNSTFDYVSESGIKITLNGKSEITSLTIPEDIKNSPDFTKLLIHAINHANEIVKDMIQKTLIKELLKHEPELLKDLKIKKFEMEEELKS